MTSTDGAGETAPLVELIEESGMRRQTAFAWVSQGLVRKAVSPPGDQRTYVYRADFLRQLAQRRRPGRPRRTT